MLSGHKLRFYFSQYFERQNYTHTNLFNLCPVEISLIFLLLYRQNQPLIFNIATIVFVLNLIIFIIC